VAGRYASPATTREEAQAPFTQQGIENAWIVYPLCAHPTG